MTNADNANAGFRDATSAHLGWQWIEGCRVAGGGSIRFFLPPAPERTAR